MKLLHTFLSFSVFCLAVAIVASEKTEELPGPTLQGGMTAASLRLATASGQPSAITFGTGSSEYKLGVNSDGDFSISNHRTPVLVVNQKDEMIITAPNFKTKSLDVEGDFFASSVPQFRVVVREDFSKGLAAGWDNKAAKEIVSSCAGIFMLGGFGKFAKGEVTKKYTNLPPHSFLKVEATFHFIDAWVGETGFMRMDVGTDNSLVYVWTNRHSQDMEQDAVNACGGAVGEGKFAVPINVVVPHNSDSVTIGFGSTLTADDPYDQSWGVSGIQLSVI